MKDKGEGKNQRVDTTKEQSYERALDEAKKRAEEGTVDYKPTERPKLETPAIVIPTVTSMGKIRDLFKITPRDETEIGKKINEDLETKRKAPAQKQSEAKVSTGEPKDDDFMKQVSERAGKFDIKPPSFKETQKELQEAFKTPEYKNSTLADAIRKEKELDLQRREAEELKEAQKKARKLAKSELREQHKKNQESTKMDDSQHASKQEPVKSKPTEQEPVKSTPTEQEPVKSKPTEQETAKSKPVEQETAKPRSNAKKEVEDMARFLKEQGAVYFQNIQALNELVDTLRIKRAASKDTSHPYYAVTKAAEELFETLRSPEMLKVFNPDNLDNLDELNNDYKRLKQTVDQAFKKAMPEFVKHRGSWYSLQPITRNILGVLSILAFGIPALIVHFKSKRGFTGTFFDTPKTRSAEHLEQIQNKFKANLAPDSENESDSENDDKKGPIPNN